MSPPPPISGPRIIGTVRSELKLRAMDAEDLSWFWGCVDAMIGLESGWHAMANPLVLGVFVMGGTTKAGEPPWRELDSGMIARAREVRRRLSAISQRDRDVLWVLHGAQVPVGQKAFDWLSILTPTGQSLLEAAGAKLYEVEKAKRLSALTLAKDVLRQTREVERLAKRLVNLSMAAGRITGDARLAEYAIHETKDQLKDAELELEMLRAARDHGGERKPKNVVGVGKRAGAKHLAPRPLLVVLGEALEAAEDGELLRRRIKRESFALVDEAEESFATTRRQR